MIVVTINRLIIILVIHITEAILDHAVRLLLLLPGEGGQVVAHNLSPGGYDVVVDVVTEGGPRILRLTRLLFGAPLLSVVYHPFGYEGRGLLLHLGGNGVPEHGGPRVVDPLHGGGHGAHGAPDHWVTHGLALLHDDGLTAEGVGHHILQGLVIFHIAYVRNVSRGFGTVI